ncbi:hypothetical protein RugamoR64_24530 [Duganella rhizosphaerae]|uniref:hypothetical protein n=1 Tax=Duganella rhizosphaerae TaxID=2885763 RepID=UPI0030EABE8A
MTAEKYYPQAVLMWLESNQPVLVSRRSVLLWRAVHQQLAPIMGDNGFMALFCRCVDLCGVRFTWVRSTPARSSAMHAFDALGAQLAARSADEGLAASRSLFGMFYELLVQLVGESLAAGVVDAAWRDRLQHQRIFCALAPPPIKPA